MKLSTTNYNVQSTYKITILLLIDCFENHNILLNSFTNHRTALIQFKKHLFNGNYYKTHTQMIFKETFNFYNYRFIFASK
jgi:hypothetical protein